MASDPMFEPPPMPTEEEELKTENVDEIDDVKTSVCGTLPVLEQLLAEASLAEAADDLGMAQALENIMVEEEEEHFSSAFINTKADEEDEEPFVIREILDDDEQEEDKEEVFPPTRDGDDDDIIREIKIAESVYAEKTEEKGWEDDDFQPVRRNKKKGNKKGLDQRRASGASFADSESSLQDDDVPEPNGNDPPPEGANNNKQEGWSFEAEDDLEVNMLCKTALSEDKPVETSEKTCLDEVFKFDSELAQAANASDDSERLVAVGNKDGWNDLDDAFSADEDGGTVAPPAPAFNIGSTSSLDQGATVGVTSESENETECRQRKTVAAGAASGSTGVTTESESSVGNSPNVRKTCKKSKKSKKKRF